MLTVRPPANGTRSSSSSPAKHNTKAQHINIGIYENFQTVSGTNNQKSVEQWGQLFMISNVLESITSACEASEETDDAPRARTINPLPE